MQSVIFVRTWNVLEIFLQHSEFFQTVDYGEMREWTEFEAFPRGVAPRHRFEDRFVVFRNVECFIQQQIESYTVSQKKPDPYQFFS